MATTPTPRHISLDGQDHVELPQTTHDDPTPTPTAELPEPLQGSDDETSENAGLAKPSPMAVNMNQSIFGLIAAAGSRVDFNTRFDDGSSDEDEGGSLKPINLRHRDLSQTAIFGSLPPKDKRLGHKQQVPGHRLLKSFASLPKRKSRTGTGSGSGRLWEPTQEVDEQSEPSEPSSPKMPSQHPDEEDVRIAPVMSRMLEARAEMASRSSFDIERDSSGPDRTDEGEAEDEAEDEAEGDEDDEEEDTTALAKKLMEIFGFDEPERVIEEYPCWLLQQVMLQGFLYITSKHICFYAYFPKKTHTVAKSGYLSKSGKRNPKYNRYWFRLKGDVLSYYQDATNLYFPHGHIDLSFGISASITDEDKEGVHFSVVTSHRTYNFRAESAPSAKEWVKSLQRVIFRSHNDGDSVKISLPIDNIIDIEDTQMMEFSDTCKIQVIDSDETFTINEYFFSFFTFGKEAIEVIKLLVENASAEGPTAGKAIATQEGESSDQSSSPRVSGGAFRNLARVDSALTTKFLGPAQGVVPSTSPGSTSPSPHPSADEEGVLSLKSSRGRGSSGNRGEDSDRHAEERASSRIMESSESNLYSSMEEPSFASLTQSAFEDPSASQILRGSDVFQSPTMRHSQASSRDYTEAKNKALESKQGQQASSTDSQNEESAYTGPVEPPRTSTPTLQSITKMGAYPLQRAGAFADYLNKTGKRMSTLLATESMGYVEKVSGMWKGERKHYDEPAGLRPDEDELEEDDDGQIQTSNERFRAHFALPETERLQATYFGYIMRVLPLYGKIYLSGRYFCFRSLLPGTRTKLILPLKDIENAHKEKGFRFGYSGLVVVIRGHEELFFEFRQAEIRDDCAVTLLQCLETDRHLQESVILEKEYRDVQNAAVAERDALKIATGDMFADRELQLAQSTASLSQAPHIMGDDLETSMIQFKSPHPMKITCLTIGSRGDVQPYIALCKGLLADGHKPRIATHAEFQGWIESHGIEFACVEGDPGELMRLCIENGTFTLSFLREANATFRGWLDDLLDSAYKACEGSELLIESPSAMAGIHIAEKLGIPYFRAFTMPWTRTRAYPHAFIMPENKMGGAYNYMTYVMFDNIFWKATAHQVNRWRNKTLGLPNTGLEKMQPNKVPFLYNFSPSVVAPPLDFSDWVRVTGYWFLDEGGDYEPPQELRDFIAKARADGKKIVYVGFGSIIVNDPAKMTQEVIDAILKADVRCILSKGWSDRITTGRDEPTGPPMAEPVMPPEIHVIKSAPHDWLFRQIDAAAHHGGSGTTGASLRAGIPTIIRPFFGDQFFFASRVEDLGVGVWVKKWGTKSFGRALWEVTRNERMIVKARLLGEQIRKESGVETAIQSIYRDMEYAKSLIKHTDGHLETEEDEDTEESWTFVRGDEPDPDVITTKLSEGLDGVALGNNSKASGKA